MPASDTGGTQTPAGARAIVEPLVLDAGSLGDEDYSALSLQHSGGQYTNADLETLVGLNFQAELDRLQSDELGPEGSDVIVSSEETVESFVEIDGTAHEVPPDETILPDVSDDDIADEVQHEESILPDMADDGPPLRAEVAGRAPQGRAVVLVRSSAGASLAPGGGQVAGKLSGTPLTQSFLTAKSVDGKTIQLRPAAARASMPGFRPLQAAVKRPAPGAVRNVYAKVIITGNQGAPQPQPIVLATSQAQSLTCAQPLKLISGTGHQTIVSSPTRAITFAQAQQMGLLSPSKLQQILPSSSNKQSGIVVNKIVSGSPLKTTPKITMMQAGGVKSPAKILPAPVNAGAQLKPAATSAPAPATPGSGKPLLSPNKVIIRQSIKPGTLLTNMGTSQVIRIPSSQATGNVIQMQGAKGVQYVRVMNPGNTTGLNKPRMVTVSSIPGNLKPVTIRAGGQPLHQQQPVKMVPIAPATGAARPVAPKAVSGQRILIPAGATQAGNHVRATAAKSILPATSANVAYMVPAQYVQQVRNQVLQGQASSAPQPTSLLSASASTPSSAQQEAGGGAASTPPDAVPLSPPRAPQPARTSVEPNGIRPRKPCNCTKSQCLKLYCDCFANGEFCFMCNCNNCFNNLQHEEDRQGAIKSCLERNPNAFRPKIGKGHLSDERRHNKGCNCKRSGCLKNYCECYEAKIPCSNNCKCVGCRNLEEADTIRSTLRDLADVAESRVLQHIVKKENLAPNVDKTVRPFAPAPTANFKQPFSFMTQAVVKATVECMLASAEEAEMNDLSEEVTERLMIEELGRCLVEVIRCSDKSDAASLEAGKTATPGAAAT